MLGSEVLSLLASDRVDSIMKDLNVNVSIPTSDWLDARWQVGGS